MTPMRSRLRVATKWWSIGGKSEPASDQEGIGKLCIYDHLGGELAPISRV